MRNKSGARPDRFNGLKPRKDYFDRIENLQIDEDKKHMVCIIWLEYFLHLNDAAKKGWATGNAAKIVILTLGLIIPVLSQIQPVDKSVWKIIIPVTISVFSLIITLITALTQQFNLGMRWQHYRYYAELIRIEGENFLSLSGKYQSFADHNAAYRTFCSAITEYKRNELTQYMEKQNGNDKGKPEEKTAKGGGD